MKKVRFPRFAHSGTLLATAGVCAALVIAPFVVPRGASADTYDDQIRALEAEIDGFQQEAARLSREADTLQNKIAQLQSQQDAIQTQIDLNEAKRQKLESDIRANEIKLGKQQEVLSNTIGDLYIDSGTTPIELLASSTSIGDYIDQQEYQSSIRDNLQTSIRQIRELKQQLTEQKQDVENVITEQKGRQSELVAKQNEQDTLLRQTRGEQSAYRELAADRRAQIAEVRAAQEAAYAAARAAWTGGFITVGGTGGYPWAGQGLSLGGCGSCVDPWDLYVGQCVSYVAWRLSNQGYRVYPFAGAGDAAQWPPTTTSTWASVYGEGNGARIRETPRAGYAAVDPNIASPYGHIMYVEQVNGNGTINISEYNFVRADTYSERTVPTSGLIFLEFARQ